MSGKFAVTAIVLAGIAVLSFIVAMGLVYAGQALALVSIETFPSAGVLTCLVGCLLSSALTALFLFRRAVHASRRQNTRLLAALDAYARGHNEARVALDTDDETFNLLAANINAALDHNAQLMSSLSSLTECVAHELRLPLDRLSREVKKLDTLAPPMASVVGDIFQGLECIHNTFNALLEVAELEARIGGHLELIHLQDCVDHALELLSHVAQEKSVTLRKETTTVSVMGSFPLLVQAVANLLDNAIKYSHPLSTVSIVLSRDKRHAFVQVLDQGDGCDLEPLSLVFDKFVRGGNHFSFEGHGLGLPLVKAIAIRHGGNVQARNLTPGFEVTLTLPLLETSF